MTENIHHERCSELLRDYARDELEVSERKTVEGHLASCADCRGELAALRALLAVDPAPLDARERRRLHAAVDRAVGGRASPEPAPARRTWLQRFAPSLGAAALLLVVLVVALSGGRIGGDDEGATPAQRSKAREAGDAGGGGAEPAEDEAAEAPAQPGNKKAKADGEETRTLESAGRAPGPQPVFRSALVRELGDMAGSRLLSDFAESYTVADAEKRWETFLRKLSEDAPAGAATQVETCGGEVDETEGGALLPAAGAYGRIANEPSLVLSFVYSDQSRGPLESYMVWAWPRGSCSERLDFTSGSIED